MTGNQFMEYAMNLVREYAYDHLDCTDGIGLNDFDVYTVWYAFELGHIKTLISTSLPDGMYYEVTYNSNKYEVYFDAYKKFENKCVKLAPLEKGE